MANRDGPGALAPGRDCMSRRGSFQAVRGKGTEAKAAATAERSGFRRTSQSTAFKMGNNK